MTLGTSKSHASLDAVDSDIQPNGWLSQERWKKQLKHMYGSLGAGKIGGALAPYSAAQQAGLGQGLAQATQQAPTSLTTASSWGSWLKGLIK